MTEQVQEQPVVENEEEPNGSPEGSPEQPEAEPQPKEAPFFVARTQEDFNKKAGLERDALRRSVAKDFGYENPEDLKAAVEAQKQWEEENQTATDKLTKQVEKLTPKAEKAERYEKALTAVLEKERDGLPAHITSLLDKMDPAEQLEYISENRDALKAPEKKPSGIEGVRGDDTRITDTDRANNSTPVRGGIW